MQSTSWPETPRKLLENRYQAFVRKEIDYILETHHPDTKAQINRSDIESWSRDSKWLGLDIQEESTAEADRAFVTFTVRYERNYEILNHFERAEFRKHESRWFYYDSEFPKPLSMKREGEKVGRNDPCSCGSGKKFKKCHGL